MLIFGHPACLEHLPGSGHPDQPARLLAVTQALRLAFGHRLSWHESACATPAQLALAHTSALITQLQSASPQSGWHAIDADTRMSPRSLEAGLRAAGAVCAAVDALVAGPYRRAFCAVRPPGHHSTRALAMGFCLFNSVAIGALHALHAHGMERVAIVDFDVHHGNGTQDIVAQDPRVLFVSSHQSPLYPGSGRSSERGVGNVVNGELPAMSGSAQFRQLWAEVLLPRIVDFAPQLLLISAGFDAHYLDPLADLHLGAQDYHWLSTRLCEIADQFANGRVVSSLEGGYSLSALRESSVAHVAALLGD